MARSRYYGGGKSTGWANSKRRKYRSKPRRSYAKKRSIFRSKRMSTRKILNITATKKRDTMMAWTNSSPSSQFGGATYTNNAAVINGSAPDSTAQVFLWNATARDNSTSYSAANPPTGSIFNTSTRTSSNPYMVGLAESIEIQCNTGMPWQWRRICFTMKGPSLVPTSTASGAVFSTSAESSNGWLRMMNQVGGNPGQNPMYNLMVPLFRGQVGADWIDPMTAATDNSRVTIKYDKTITLSSGNEDGFIRTYKRWHPMKSTLVYDDDEQGGSKTVNIQSVSGKAGMGDYYVMDMFRARQGSAVADQLTVRPTATLYWHEK
ncbi:capsid protein [Alces alces faeces associated genomovirus MP43]|uniref:Capsid protein n=1 Tax=Alces alces faeces associated genomovirus MP43 TaxID=2219114 RepID=A0A2Z5CHP9_9VIRU|nr:capsid protein [Alces alces faeces associated genomovirus MP43]AXB22619.1 capsid protein [Alces alces faeces associated genomovirus MP43]